MAMLHFLQSLCIPYTIWNAQGLENMQHIYLEHKCDCSIRVYLMEFVKSTDDSSS